ncbi:pyridoxamine 5'-phosphate oxidase family protein [Nonomuraea diastatica]|uniref:Pyridoxamine 5-phosphate oxidase n=1 Tax=Nonomuraea diastatica TaxID=1848329 RepID=A0A4R4WEQ3_9ACTN|nr:pyridoxamine 5'-phosphate oxidase family protein [Nonomuraea diastatica]TDD16751.1 pyridoxamine 5-phosphate oxidase [Nonomuraea diastatica]
MASWQEFERQAPALAEVARRLMEGCRGRVLATLRKDGSPRVSGIETIWRDGELWTGSMPRAVKAFDLRRDPRMAIHVASAEPDVEEPSAWEGDVKLAGRAVEVTDPEVLEPFQLPGSDSHLFRIELAKVVWTRIEGDEMGHGRLA